jgi:uncharacterized protein (TIGR02246 family)
MTTETNSSTAQRVADDMFAELEAAWNAADGTRFGRAFTDDADFVNIRGEHHKSAVAIGAGHQGIFDSIYAGSAVRYTALSAEPIAEGCVLGIAAGHLEVPAGPLQGTYRSTLTAVLLGDAGSWMARAHHNTLVVD